MSSALKVSSDHILDSVVKDVTDLIGRESGNVFGEEQLSMVVNRLKKRMLVLGGMSSEEYKKYLNDNLKEETKVLLSLLTTHHTFFFREFIHFEYLISNMDSIVENVRKRGDDTVRIYSAACSRGQEVYSLAMLFRVHMENKYPGITFSVYGTDIDPESAAFGNNGVYRYNEVKSVPKVYISGNWQRGTGDISDFVRVKPELKKYCSFDPGNLLDLKKTLRERKFDVILCRNVLIYLSLEDNEKVVNDFQNFLHPGGVLITGLSESLKNMTGLTKVPVNLGPSIYSFDVVSNEEAKVSSTGVEASSAKVVSSAVSKIPKPIRMLCVDDSKAIVKLLTKIFDKDPDFEMVGTAGNGIEAAEFLKNNKVDAMTLDIHMPEMDGVEYLKSHHSSSHPKVVVVSSASREDTRYALETLKHGATDFVEKPSLNNIGERADEIKMKLKMAFLNSSEEGSVSSIDNAFAKDFVIDDLENKARVLMGTFSNVNTMCRSLKELRGKQPATFMFFEGNENYLDEICDRIKNAVSMPVSVWSEGESAKSDNIYICDFRKDMPALVASHSDKPVSISIYGQCSKRALESFMDFNVIQILVEDSPDLPEDFKAIASDVFPVTSFSHVATEFLADPFSKKYER